MEGPLHVRGLGVLPEGEQRLVVRKATHPSKELRDIGEAMLQANIRNEEIGELRAVFQVERTRHDHPRRVGERRRKAARRRLDPHHMQIQAKNGVAV